MKLLKTVITLILIVSTYGIYSNNINILVNKIVTQLVLSDEELKNISSASDLQNLRNAVFAYHGYKFKNQKIIRYFENYTWYIPKFSNVDDKLTEIDKTNIRNIQFRELDIRRDQILLQLNKKVDPKLSENEKRIIGIWQDSAHMSSGWTNSYAFYPNRIVIFRTNQMDGERRVLSKIGYWQIKNNNLLLEYMFHEILVGGHLVPSNGSYTTKMYLKDAMPVSKNINPVHKEIYSISDIVQDPNPDRSSYLMFHLNNDLFWKMRDNPNDYQ